MSVRVCLVGFLLGAVLLGGRSNMVHAQISTDYTRGYCANDINANGLIDYSELPATDFATPTVDTLTSELLYTLDRANITNGAVNNVRTAVQGHPDILPLQPFDGTTSDADGAGNGTFTIGGGTNVTFDIDNRCVTGATRTDTDTSDDSTATHTTVDIIIDSVNVSERDIGGFAFQGNLVLEFTADVGGDVTFDAGGDDNDITLTINQGSEIYGDVIFTDGANSASDIVFSNAGSITDVDLDNTSNVVFTNSGLVGGTGLGSGVDAKSVGVGLTINNNNGGTITNIDASDTDRLVINNANGTSIEGILLNSATDTSTTDVSTRITNAGQIDIITADRQGQLTLVNSATGRIESLTDNALVLSNSATLDFINAGTISAASSDTIDLTDYSGSLTLTNSGTISASTNNVIIADGSSGTYTINNNGTISNNNNRGLSMQNITGGGDITFNNGSATATGQVSSNQSALDFTDSSGDSEMNVIVSNAMGSLITANFGNAIAALNVDSFSFTNNGSVTAGVAPTLNVSDADALTINNATAAAAITASSDMAIDADDIDGAVSITNVGTISAFNRTINLHNAEGAITIANSGTISATHSAENARANLVENYAIDANRKSGATGAAIIVTNADSAIISINSDRALGLRSFNHADDSVAVTNSGTISAGRDRTLDLTGSRKVTVTNNAPGVISAGEDLAVDVTGILGSVTLTNSGTISAGATRYDASTGAIRGVLGAGGVNVILSNAGTISSVGGNTVHLTNIGDAVTVTNSGIISAGDTTTDEQDNAVYLSGIGANAVVFTSSSSGVISATGDTAIYIDGGASIDFDNLGTSHIEADDTVINFTAANNPTLDFNNASMINARDDDANHLLDVSGVRTTLNITNSGTMSTNGTQAIAGRLHADGAALTLNNSGSIMAEDGNTVYLQAIAGALDVDNSGTISAGNGTDESSFALRLLGIGGNNVNFNNATGGIISATQNTAIELEGAQALTFNNHSGGLISAENNVILFTNTATDPTINFTNAGTIVGTDRAADHVLDFDAFTGTLSITNSGLISSGGTNAITGTVAGSTALHFVNNGTIASVGANAVKLDGFGGNVTLSNNSGGRIIAGSIGGTADHAVHITGGQNVTFDNAGMISATGTEAVFFENTASGAHSFTNSGTIIGGNVALRVTQATPAATAPSYSLTNSGTIRSTGTGLAVDFSNLPVTLNSSGSIITAGSTALQVGGGSTIIISGPLHALGSNPVALALGGTASTITLNDGARLLGDFRALDTGSIVDNADKHKVTLSAVENASYFYDFDDRYFRFVIDGVETDQASGFSPGTSNYDAGLIAHRQHGAAQRRLFHELGGANRDQPLKTIAFTSSIDEDDSTDRNYTLDVEQSGFAQSVQGSVFGFFTAEIILAGLSTKHEVDRNLFTYDSSYTGAGLGFSDLASIGPFSISALAMAGIGDVGTKRRVYTNTNVQGYLDVKSTYDVAYLDVTYEALFNRRVYGAHDRFTRRRPYRVNLEVALGGSVHKQDRNSFTEGSYITNNAHSLTSASTMVRFRAAYYTRSRFSRQPFFLFGELQYSASDITDGDDFGYIINGVSYSHTAQSQAVGTSTVRLGGQYRPENDMAFDFSINYAAGDDDFDNLTSAASVIWKF